MDVVKTTTTPQLLFKSGGVGQSERFANYPDFPDVYVKVNDFKGHKAA